MRISQRTTLHHWLTIIGRSRCESDPIREHMVDDRLGGGTDDQRLFEFLAAAVRNYRKLGREPLDVLGFLLDEALRDEQREVCVAGAGALDALVELVAHRLPNGKSVGTETRYIPAPANSRPAPRADSCRCTIRQNPRCEGLPSCRFVLLVFPPFVLRDDCDYRQLVQSPDKIGSNQLIPERVRSESHMKLRPRAAAAGLALAIAIPVFAPAASAESGANTPAVRTIKVDGSGETRTSPDSADLDVAIETQTEKPRKGAPPHRAGSKKTAPPTPSSERREKQPPRSTQ